MRPWDSIMVPSIAGSVSAVRRSAVDRVPTGVDRAIDFGRGLRACKARTLWPMAAVPARRRLQWQRPLLPAAVLAESDGRRNAARLGRRRVDVRLLRSASAWILGSTSPAQRSDVRALDAGVGVVAFVALWFRRGRPGRRGPRGRPVGGSRRWPRGARSPRCSTPRCGCACAVAARRRSRGWRRRVSAYAYGNPDGYDWSGLVVGRR